VTITVADWIDATIEAQRLLFAARGRRLKELGARNWRDARRLCQSDEAAGLFDSAGRHMGQDLEALECCYLESPVRSILRVMT
jgi:hypothetical protein